MVLINELFNISMRIILLHGLNSLYVDNARKHVAKRAVPVESIYVILQIYV